MPHLTRVFPQGQTCTVLSCLRSCFGSQWTDKNDLTLQWMFHAQYLSPLVSSATMIRLKCQAVASPVPLCQMCSSCSWPMWRKRKANSSVEPREKASALLLASCWRLLLHRFPAWTNKWLKCPNLLACANRVSQKHDMTTSRS